MRLRDGLFTSAPLERGAAPPSRGSATAYAATAVLLVLMLPGAGGAVVGLRNSDLKRTVGADLHTCLMPTLYAYAAGDRTDPHAVQLQLSEEDMDSVLGVPRAEAAIWHTVRDTQTGVLWDARRAACGSGCYCAAEARPS